MAVCCEKNRIQRICRKKTVYNFSIEIISHLAALPWQNKHTKNGLQLQLKREMSRKEHYKRLKVNIAICTVNRSYCRNEIDGK